MAQLMIDTQLEMPEKRTGLISLDDWLKLEEEAEAKAEAARLADEPTKKKSKKGGTNRIEANTIVTRQPSTNSAHDGNDPISYAEPTSILKVDLSNENWVGLLTGYHQSHLQHSSPTYTESSPSLNLYTCLVTLSERPSSPLGDPKAIFAKKKDAKQYAAKLAVEWLIANGHMPSDGSVSFPKARPPQATPTPKPKPALTSASASGNSSPTNTSSTANGNLNSAPSHVQRVASLCASLDLSPPTYKLLPNPAFGAMYSGYAVFESSPLVMGRVGEVRNVFGKKNAREACAEVVAGILEGVVRERRERANGGAEGGRGMGGEGGSLLDF